MLEVRGLNKSFPIESGLLGARGFVRAVHNVNLQIYEQEIVALVGESGSGKSTIGKLIQGLLAPDSGQILFDGKSAAGLTRTERAHCVQTIFQDPFSSLNPKLSVGTMLGEAVRLAGSNEKVESLLESVGLPTDILHDYPHQFSGGQRQRLGIARALAMKPRLIIADEPVSALDVIIQAQILRLLEDLKNRLKISCLLITHDLAIVEAMAGRVLILKEGEVVEQGTVSGIFNSPKHIYTQTLLAAVPKIRI